MDVRLERVTKRFGDMVAVDDLSLEIRAGEFLSLLGPSGCGKTTTLRMIGGFEDPSMGRISIGGTDVTAMPPYRREVNTVFQSYAVFPHLNVAQNVGFGLQCRHVPKAEVAARVQQALDLVDLSKLGARKPSQLSGGQQQRVALARALVNRPKLLLLDEPMSALDAKLRKQMQIELKRIQAEVGITFLYVTHDQEEAMTMSDRIAVMNGGHIEGLAEPQQLYERPETEFVATFLGASNLLTGQVVSSSGTTVTVAVEGNTVTATLDGAGDVKSGAVRVGVRPEKMHIAPDDHEPAPGWNAVHGTLIVATFTGVGNQYLVRGPEGAELTVYAQNIGRDAAPRTGDRVLLTWRPEHTFVVRPSDGSAQPPDAHTNDEPATLRTPTAAGGRRATADGQQAAEPDQPPEFDTANLDPSVVRGLTVSRFSRRQVLGAAAGVGAGAVGLAAALGVFGGGGSSGSGTSLGAGAASGGGGGGGGSSAVGSAAWWAQQPHTHLVNFGNWPLYIDILNGKSLSLEHFTAATGVKVNYTTPIDDNAPFYVKIRPELEAKQYTGYDIIVLTTNNPQLGYMIDQDWLIPLDRSAMSNFEKYAGPLIKSPSWDPGNKYTMAWQSGWTAIGYNAAVIKDPVDSVSILFDKRYAGKVGMMSDPIELGSVGLLALGIEPSKSTETDWQKAAKLLQRQKSDGIVRAYYDQGYIDHLKNGDIVVSQAYSGDMFQANLSSKYKNLRLLMPKEGAMFWTDNMCIPMYSQNPKDAMNLMDYFYDPSTQAVVEYYNDYISPVPAARDVLLHPAGWAKTALKQLEPSIGEPPSVTADAPTVFPNAQYEARSRNYYSFKNQDEVTAWNNLFLPIVEGS